MQNNLFITIIAFLIRQNITLIKIITNGQTIKSAKLNLTDTTIEDSEHNFQIR